MSYHNTLYTLDLSWTGTEHNVAQRGQWDMGPLRWDSGLPWTVPTVPWIGWTVGYGGPQMGQWTPMDNPICPMVQWDRTDSGILG